MTDQQQQPNSQPTAWHGDSHKDFVAGKGWKTGDDAITGYQNLEKLIGAEKAGRSVVLPKDENDVEGNKAFRAKLGVPEKVDGYAIPEAYREALKDDALMPHVAAAALKHGLTPKQYEGFLADVLGPAAKLAGSGRVTGQIDGAAGTPTFRGRLDADLAAAELTLPTPVVLTAVRADGVPVYWNAGGVEQPGAVSVARLVAHGLTVEDLASSATLIDGLVRLPDLRYRHHEGHGSGWAEIALGGATPLRARVEGEDVDLAAVVRDTGSTVAQVTGRVRYTGSLQRLRGRGVDAVVELRSQERGEIGIEALERLLASPAVEVESTGLLRQTLENLRVFEYESLDGVLRATDGQGTVDLSITGRRRLGLFPGPVQAINFRNVPLDVLSRTLDRGTSR